MTSDAKPRIAIVGVGRLGGHWCRWLTQARYVISAMSSRNTEMMRKVMHISGSSAGLFPDPSEAAQQAELTLITVPDAQISGIAEEIAAKGMDWRSKTFLHCSGVSGAELLSPLAARGASVGVLHPMQSFAPISAETKRSPFSGATISIECGNDIFPLLLAIVEALGARAIRLSSDPDVRARYHASAVMASNALVSLLDASVEMLVGDGQSEEGAKRALLPLIFGTLANVSKMSLGEALTGPVVRGDRATLAQHLAAIPENMHELYRSCMEQAIRLAQRSERIDYDTAEALRDELGL